MACNVIQNIGNPYGKLLKVAHCNSGFEKTHYSLSRSHSASNRAGWTMTHRMCGTLFDMY